MCKIPSLRPLKRFTESLFHSHGASNKSADKITHEDDHHASSVALSSVGPEEDVCDEPDMPKLALRKDISECCAEDSAFGKVERALAPQSKVKERCFRSADKMHAGENFRLYAAILRLEKQQETGTGKNLPAEVKNVLDLYIRPNSKFENGCLSDRVRRDVLLGFVSAMHKVELSSSNHGLSLMKKARAPQPTIDVHALFARVKAELERDINGNPDLREIIDRALDANLEKSGGFFHSS